MKMEYWFYGHSDDSVEVDGHIRKHYAAKNNICQMVVYDLFDKTQRVLVTGTYTESGTWTFGIGPYIEGETIPDWGFKFEPNPENEYSFRFVIRTRNKLYVERFDKFEV